MTYDSSTPAETVGTTDDTPPVSLPAIILRCPSCEQTAEFAFIGEQRWPAAVAARIGVAPRVRLYVCGQCRTTLSLPVEEP